jgi:endonuclease/exonuclease/phosphatase family metal-dependent hydrolase
MVTFSNRLSPTRMTPHKPSPSVRHRVTRHLRRTSGAVQELLRELRPAATLTHHPITHVHSPAAGDLRVASYNLHKCVGTDRRFDPVRSTAVIAELKADLVALQEADRRFGRRTGLLDLKVLERETGLAPLPVSDEPDGHGWHGNVLLVRPGTPARLRRLVLPGAEPRGALVAELDLPMGQLRVVAAHLGLLRNCRKRQAAAILHAIAESGDPMPTLLLGDLNEWRPGVRSSLRAFAPLFHETGLTPPSFPARMPVFALDRILGWPKGLVGGVTAHDTPLARIASDHLPLTATVRLEAAMRESIAKAA